MYPDAHQQGALEQARAPAFESPDLPLRVGCVSPAPPAAAILSLEDEKLRAVLERQTRFQLRGYEEELMSQRGASQWPTSGTGCYFSVRFMLDENLLSLRFRVFQQNRSCARPHF